MPRTTLLLVLGALLTPLTAATDAKQSTGRQLPLEDRKKQAHALIEKGEFKIALELSRELNKAAPDDLDTYALLVDAYRGLGRFENAKDAAQWMLNLRPTDPRGLSKAALLREDAGDVEGAIQLWNECYHRTLPGDDLNRAAYLAELARLFQKSGKANDARQLAAESLRLRPHYGPAQKVLDSL